MKKAKYFLLLVPSLFLLTSCGNSTATDLISEADARKFINERFKDAKPAELSKATTITWNIANDSQATRDIIGSYINFNKDPVGSNTGTNVAITDASRLNQYKVGDLANSAAMGALGTDAVVAMNPSIYNLLWRSEQNNTHHYLTYKYWGAGLAIISNLQDNTYKETRCHYYDQDGHELIYQVMYNTVDYNYTMTINFKY